MIKMKFRNVLGFVVLLGITGLVQASTLAPLADDGVREPALPPGCSSLLVEPGHKVAFRTYAVGVQIYRWNGNAWEFVAPEANLYADAGFRGKVGSHYGGPTWETNSGSTVVARRADGCSPDPTAIAWLLLETVSTDGPGIFNKVTFIQRVNTAGGLPPSMPAITVGQIARVPYTTEYYFYRQQNQ